MTRRKTVVVADDDAVVRHLVRDTLAMAGVPVDVLEARTGTEALAHARRGPVDLVLLDVGMPELDGIQTCRALKADPATAGAPVLFLSVRRRPASRLGALDAGASGYLNKPFSPRVLSATVRCLLGV